MRVNEQDNQTLPLASIIIENVLIPELSEGEKKIGQSFNNLESSINSEDDVLMSLLKYSFVLRFVSNNQIIVYSSLLESSVPINLHLSTQALSSGMKPLSERFESNQPEYKSAYSTLFEQKLDASSINESPPLIKKLYLNGYTNNILINDPFFSQMFFIYLTLLITITLYLLSRAAARKTPEHRFYNSLLFKFYMFVYSQFLKIIESSLLTILVTNFVILSELRISKQWDIYGLLTILLLDAIIIYSTSRQLQMMNQQIRSPRELKNIEMLFRRYISDIDYDRWVKDLTQNRLARYLRINFHFFGFLKKVLLFVILVGIKEQFQTQIVLIYIIMGTYFLMGVLLRPFKNALINFLRSLSDFTLIFYFIFIHLCDKVKRDLIEISRTGDSRVTDE